MGKEKKILPPDEPKDKKPDETVASADEKAKKAEREMIAVIRNEDGRSNEADYVKAVESLRSSELFYNVTSDEITIYTKTATMTKPQPIKTIRKRNIGQMDFSAYLAFHNASKAVNPSAKGKDLSSNPAAQMKVWNSLQGNQENLWKVLTSNLGKGTNQMQPAMTYTDALIELLYAYRTTTSTKSLSNDR